MKAIILLFDSLNRRLLPPYGGSVVGENFQRLADRSLTFDNSYCCSMPCMPARRDFHTGRPNFLHRAWGPLEPYDDSVPQMLTDAGVYTHLVSDHYHYWEEGGSNYHCKYNTWEAFRGQEGDPWIGQVADPQTPTAFGKNAQLENRKVRQDWINRENMPSEELHNQTLTIDAGIDFIKRNSDQDNWFLQIECFDPHEPFFAPQRFRELYENASEENEYCDWPIGGKNDLSPEQVKRIQKLNAALHSMCDESLGRLMDLLDQEGLWDDTLFIVWTDHGILLNEHDEWLKNAMPLYNEIAQTPFFVWDPRTPRKGERRQALVQPAIDLGPTLLRYFGLEPTERMLGKDLQQTIEDDASVRDAAIFGFYAMHVNITDGDHTLMKGRDLSQQALFEYTLLPTLMDRPYPIERLQRASLGPSFSFSKNCPHLEIPARLSPDFASKDLLFDLHSDPRQLKPISESETFDRLANRMTELMKESDAPACQYQSLGLTPQ